MKSKLILHELVVSKEDALPADAFMSEMDIPNLQYEFEPLSGTTDFTIIRLFVEVEDEDPTKYTAKFEEKLKNFILNPDITGNAEMKRIYREYLSE